MAAHGSGEASDQGLAPQSSPPPPPISSNGSGSSPLLASSHPANSPSLSSSPSSSAFAPASASTATSNSPGTTHGGGGPSSHRHQHSRSRSVNLSPTMRSGSLFTPASVGPGSASNDAHHALLQHLVPARVASPQMIPPASAAHSGHAHSHAHSQMLEAGWRPHSAGSSDGSDGSSASSSPESRRGAFARHMERSASNPSSSLSAHSPRSTSSSPASMARRAVSPSRAFAMPLSPRLQAFGGQSHGRKLSGGAEPIPRIPSPLLSPNASARTLSLNPDPELPIDTVWVADDPRQSPDGSHEAGHGRHTSAYTPVPPSLRDEYSPTPASAISVPGPSSPRRRGGQELAAGSPVFSRDMSHSPVLRLQRTPSPSSMAHSRHERKRSGSSGLASSSPRLSPAALPSSPSSSPSSRPALAVPKPIATKKALDFQQSHARTRSGSSPSPTLAASDQDDDPSSSTLGESSSPITKIFSPVGQASTRVNPQHALAEVSAASNSGEKSSALHGDERMADDSHGPTAPHGSSPSPRWVDSSAPSTSPTNYHPGSFGPESFLRARSPALSPRVLAADGIGGAESPPKTRSFIGMPPRSGYELSDDPDDVGSEDGSSGRESVGTNDDRDDEDDDDEEEEEGEGASSHVNDGGFVDELDGEEAGVPSTATEEAKAARPVAPRRPSLTHAPVVPPVPANEGFLGYFRSSDDESMGWRSSVIERAEERIRGEESSDDSVSPSSSSSDAAGLRPFLTLSSGVIDGPSPFDGPMPTAKEAEGMPGEASAAIEYEVDEDGEGGMDAQPTEESLTTLERIFLFAKSDMAFHRVLVARSLADWILDVELSDAVEYVIPLLNGLACDELEVCSAFVPNLHKVMWFFFRNCPLTETSNEGLGAGSGESRDTEGDNGAPVNAGQGKESVPEDEVERATRPRLSVSIFTPMLCALLLNSNAELAGSAQAALVHFFARLHGLAILGEPGEQQSQQVGEPQLTEAFEETTALVRDAAAREGLRVQLAPYQFGPKERELVEAELLDNVAFAIGKLHANPEGPEEDGVEDAMEEQDRSQEQEQEQERDHHVPDEKQGQGPELQSQTSQQEEQEDDGQFEQIDFNMDEAEPIANGVGINGIERREDDDDDDVVDMEEANGKKDDDLDDGLAAEEVSFDPHVQSQTMEDWSQDQYEGSSPVLSAFGKYHIDEEAAVGRMASVSLLAALSTDKLVQQDVLVERIVPEIVRLHSDDAFFVRKEVAIAMGALARSVVDAQVLTDQLLPAFMECCKDKIWHVRQAACLSLPNMYSRVDAETRRMNVVPTMRAFVLDVSRNVRAAALETIGEVIYLFYNDPQGVPEPLLRHYLGEPFDGQEEEDDDAQMEDDSSSIDQDADSWSNGGFMASDMQRQSLLTDFGFGHGPNGVTKRKKNAPPSTWSAEGGAYRSDPERSLVMAYNLPAVLLTVGKEQWPRLRAIHQDLCTDVSGKVRRSLAASLHEVAKIVGPQAASQDILPLFRRALVEDNDIEVRAAALEHADVLLSHVDAVDGEAELRKLHGMWQTTFASSWRLRERLVQLIPSLAPKFLLSDDEGTLVHLMRDAIVDVVSAVRAAGVTSVPTLYQIFEEHDQVVADGFLGMVADIGENESYRARVGCLMSMQALFHHRVQRSSVEMLLLGRLVALGRDPVVDVRIALAKAVALMCRLEELYASPQSRSDELIDLLRRLTHDRSADVRNIILGVLGPDDPARKLDETITAEVEEEAPRRDLVLGPADGGPHRPPRDESTLTNGDSMMMMLMEGQSQTEPFAMDEDADDDRGPESQVSSSSPGEVGLRRFSDFYQHQPLEQSAEGDSSMFEDADDDDGEEEEDDDDDEDDEDDDQAKDRYAKDSNSITLPSVGEVNKASRTQKGLPSSFEEEDMDDEPHHLLSVGPDSPERAFPQVQLQSSSPSADSQDASLTSPERPFKLVANGSEPEHKSEAGATADPFLAFVVDKRSSFHGGKLVPPPTTAGANAKARPLAIDAKGANDNAALHKIESLRSPGAEEPPHVLFGSKESPSSSSTKQEQTNLDTARRDNHEKDTSS